MTKYPDYPMLFQMKNLLTNSICAKLWKIRHGCSIYIPRMTMRCDKLMENWQVESFRTLYYTSTFFVGMFTLFPPISRIWLWRLCHCGILYYTSTFFVGMFTLFPPISRIWLWRLCHCGILYYTSTFFVGCLHCFLRYHGSGCAGCVIVEYCITLARYVLDVYTVSPDITDLVVEAASLWNIVLH